MPQPRSSRVVFVIAHRDFRDEEFFVPREVLEKADIDVVVSSFKTDVAVGLHGGVVPVDSLVSAVRSADFDALLIAGGPGIAGHFDDSDLRRVILEFNNSNRIIGAICAAPTALAMAGILQGKNATVWRTKDDGEFVRTLIGKGAFYHDAPVVADGNIITANSPAAAVAFAEQVVSLIKSGKTSSF